MSLYLHLKMILKFILATWEKNYPESLFRCKYTDNAGRPSIFDWLQCVHSKQEVLRQKSWAGVLQRARSVRAQSQQRRRHKLPLTQRLAEITKPLLLYLAKVNVGVTFYVRSCREFNIDIHPLYERYRHMLHQISCDFNR